MIDNFDQSSSGINLSLNIFKDCDRSQMEFEDSFHVYQYGSQRKTPILIWTQHGNYAFDNHFFDDDAHKIPEGMSESDLLESLKEWLDEDVYMEIAEDFFDLKETLTFEAVMQHAEREIDDFIDWKDEVLEQQYEEIGVRGYCQGDYAEVIVPHKTLEGTPYHPDYKGEDKKPISELAYIFEKIIYDAPITGRLEVSKGDFETEVYLDEDLEDQYNYDEDEIVQIVCDNDDIQKLPKKDIEYIIEWVGKNLPEHLDYVD